jgi:putative ABC transport system permease protein
MAQPRFSMLLLGAFAMLAVVLASVGMYGAVSYSVVRRTPEIGVRLALGAGRAQIFSVILGEGMRVALAGVAAGLAAAYAVSRLLAGFLYGVEATDASTFAATPMVLLAVTALACYLPARRAASIDPLITMRSE